MVVVAGTQVVPRQTVARQNPLQESINCAAVSLSNTRDLELPRDGVRHPRAGPPSADHDAAGVVEDGQAAAPQHQRVVGVRPRHQSPVLELTGLETKIYVIQNPNPRKLDIYGVNLMLCW